MFSLLLFPFALWYLSQELWAGQSSSMITSSSTALIYSAWDLWCGDLSLLKYLVFIQIWYQTVLLQLDIFSTVQAIANFNHLFWNIFFYVSPKTLTSKFHSFLPVFILVSLSWWLSDKYSLIRMQSLVLFQISTS